MSLADLKRSVKRLEPSFPGYWTTQYQDKFMKSYIYIIVASSQFYYDLQSRYYDATDDTAHPQFLNDIVPHDDLKLIVAISTQNDICTCRHDSIGLKVHLPIGVCVVSSDVDLAISAWSKWPAIGERLILPSKYHCQHEWIDVGFNFSKMVCKHCNVDQNS